MNDTLVNLRRAAREIFDDALAHMDAYEAVRRAVSLEGGRLRLVDTEFDFDSHTATGERPPQSVYSVAVGKAAVPMAFALTEILGERLAGGVLSSSSIAGAASVPYLARWQTFAGGHPTPNEASLVAARAAFALMRAADERAAPVIFLISGGGSAMLEWPRVEATTLEDLREANRLLVACGANIAEINAVRRALSAVKGGGLGARAPHAAQVSLIISDTATGEAFNVASGLTLPPPANAPEAAAVISRYRLASRLPASILRAINQSQEKNAPCATTNVLQSDTTHPDTTHPGTMQPGTPTPDTSSSNMTSSSSNTTSNDATPAAATTSDATRRHYVLLDNERALERAAEAARVRGFAVEIARDIVEQQVEEGASMLVSRLFEMARRESSHGRTSSQQERGVCLISGGEFACRVRGEGVGGRNAETALRCAFEIEARAGEMRRAGDARPGIVALCAGTDGIDGNSPAAGALADSTTLGRARAQGLDARHFLDASDAYTLFQTLGDAINTGATGTNVRDLRILLAEKEAGD